MQLALGAIDNIEDLEPVDVDQVIFDEYLAGLREMGWAGRGQVVRFGFVASGVLRVGLMLLWSLNRAFESGRLDGSGDSAGPSSEEAIELGAKQARFLLEWAGEAYALLDSIA